MFNMGLYTDYVLTLIREPNPRYSRRCAGGSETDRCGAEYDRESHGAGVSRTVGAQPAPPDAQRLAGLLADLRSDRFEQRRLGIDRHRLRNSSDLENKIQRRVLSDGERHALLSCFEICLRDRDVVLTGLEREKIAEELRGLITEIAGYLEILRSRVRLFEVLRGELLDTKERFATPPRTAIEDRCRYSVSNALPWRRCTMRPDPPLVPANTTTPSAAAITGAPAGAL